MRTNVAFNGVGETAQGASGASGSTANNGAAPKEGESSASGSATREEEVKSHTEDVGRRAGCRGRVKVNEGDAW